MIVTTGTVCVCISNQIGLSLSALSNTIKDSIPHTT